MTASVRDCVSVQSVALPEENRVRLRRILIYYEIAMEHEEKHKVREARIKRRERGPNKLRGRRRGATEIANSRVDRGCMREDEGMKRGGNTGRNREIGPSRENNDFSFVNVLRVR